VIIKDNWENIKSTIIENTFSKRFKQASNVIGKGINYTLHKLEVSWLIKITPINNFCDICIKILIKYFSKGIAV
jgi:hypothetical protein